MGNLCGVNQKLLSDALTAIKDKGKIPSLDPVNVVQSQLHKMVQANHQ